MLEFSGQLTTPDRFSYHTGAQTPAPKLPAPKCPRDQTAAPRSHVPDSGPLVYVLVSALVYVCMAALIYACRCVCPSASGCVRGGLIKYIWQHQRSVCRTHMLIRCD